MRWYDPVTGKELEDHDEVHDVRELAEAKAAREAEARAAEAAAARESAEEELAELRAQIRRLRREPGT